MTDLGDLRAGSARLPSSHKLRTLLSVVVLSAATIAVLVPFADKALHIDDPLFAWAAEQILTSPWDYYGFTVNWYGWTMPMSDVTMNPPLAAYYLAAVAAISGWNEPLMHAAFWLAALAAALGTYAIARRVCDRPLLAALLALATPVFVVSATTLMSDMLMVAFWCWAVFFWMRGVDERRQRDLAMAALIVALAGLTKYYALSLIPLLAVYALARAGKPRLDLVWLFMPIVSLAAYDRVTGAKYGARPLHNAATYATQERDSAGAEHVIRPQASTLIGLVFTGGCLATLGLYFPWVWSLRGWMAGLALALVIWLIVDRTNVLGNFELPTAGGRRTRLLAQLTLFTLLGVALCALAVRDVWNRRDAASILLALWLLGTLLFASLVNWTVNGRSILPAAPAAAILVVRGIEQRASRTRPARSWPLWLPLVPALAMAMAVAWTDMRWANSARTAAETIMQKYGALGLPVWFQGHWGFQYYMQRAGARPLDIRDGRLLVGQVMIVPENNTNAFDFPDGTLAELEEFEFRGGSILSTKVKTSGAGFYSSRHGPLPFVFCDVPPERYRVYMLKRNAEINTRSDEPPRATSNAGSHPGIVRRVSVSNK